MEEIIQLAKECHELYGFYPISFSFCHKIDSSIPIKEKTMATIIPGDFSTYIFNDETEYYNDYKKSKFGLTKCKGGWDCNRHLEIMVNHCLPLFENAENIPKYTMIHHPKKLYIEINNKKEELETNEELYKEYVYKLTNHFNQFLTGEEIANYILKVINREDVKKVLFIDGSLCDHHTDYMSMMIHNAFKMKFKQNCEVMYSNGNNKFLYQNQHLNRNTMYGKGFSYAGKVPSEYMTENERNNIYNEAYIKEKIKQHEYDLIIYGAIYWSTCHFDYIKNYYSKDEIIGFQGQDGYLEEQLEFGLNNLTLFVREPGRIGNY